MDNQPFTIAIAEDHKMTRSVICSILSHNNYQVCLSVESGQELLDRIASNGRLPDVCLVDINMPGMDGFETVKRLKERWPAVKVLAISADESRWQIAKMTTVGADGFITKNSSIQEWSNAIKRLFQ